MKRIVPAILALSLLTACGGETTSPASTTAAPVTEITTSAAETTAAATTETIAETTTTAAVTTTVSTAEVTTTDSAIATTDLLASVGSQTTASGAVSGTAKTTAPKKESVIAFKDSLTGKMSARLAKNEEPVRMYIKETAGTIGIEMNILRSGKNVYIDSVMMGFHTIVLTDGTKAYTMDAESKTYAQTDISKSIQDADNVLNLFDEAKEYGTIIDTGKKMFKGKNCDYETFNAPTEDNPMDEFTYYFDENGDLVGVTFKSEMIEKLGGMEMDFAIKFDNTIKESDFTVPKDYKEITEEEMSKKQLERMSGSDMGKLLEEMAGSIAKS